MLDKNYSCYQVSGCNLCHKDYHVHDTYMYVCVCICNCLYFHLFVIVFVFVFPRILVILSEVDGSGQGRDWASGQRTFTR